MSENKEAATKLLAEKMEQIKGLMAECRKIAKDNKLDFEPRILEYDEWSEVGYYEGWMPSSADC